MKFSVLSLLLLLNFQVNANCINTTDLGSMLSEESYKTQKDNLSPYLMKKGIDNGLSADFHSVKITAKKSYTKIVESTLNSLTAKLWNNTIGSFLELSAYDGLILEIQTSDSLLDQSPTKLFLSNLKECHRVKVEKYLIKNAYGRVMRAHLSDTYSATFGYEIFFISDKASGVVHIIKLYFNEG